MTAARHLAGALFLATLIGGLAAATVRAQTPSPREACQASVLSLCPLEAATMNRKAAKVCLLKNLAKASPECRAAIEARKAQRRAPPSS
jgi:hypothetical protein